MRIVTISDSPNIFSGLARVHRNAIDALVEAGHEVIPLCWFGYDALTRRKIQLKKTNPPPLVYQNGKTEVRLLDIPKGNNPKDIGPIFETIQFIKPDVVLTIGDFWDFHYIHPIKMKMSFAFKWFAWFTIEHQDISENWKPIFQYIDQIAAPSKFGVKAVEDFSGKECAYIPYGVDSAFEKMSPEKRLQLRRERDCERKTRFITVAQNTSRKNLPSILLAASLIMDENVEFYIHTNIDDRNGLVSFDLNKLAKQFGVQNKVKFPTNGIHSVFKAPPDQDLANEYNASDYFLMPSNCESFCLPIIEAMKCGLPVLASCSSAMMEHVGGTEPGPAQRGFLAGCRYEICPPAMFMPKVLPECLAEGVDWLKDNGSKQVTCCEEYAKEKTWDKSKLKLRETVDGLSGSGKVFVEILQPDVKGTEQETLKD